jgi:hypothetical protein
VSAVGAPVGAPEPMSLPVRRMLALAAVGAAQAHLDAIARDTDEPDWREVEAADLLVRVAELLKLEVR